jgi:membrane protein involved in colicin uptake
MRKAGPAVLIGVCVVAAFFLGRLSAVGLSWGPPSGAVVSDNGPGADTGQSDLDQEDPAERLQQVEKRLREAQAENLRLKREKSELQTKGEELERAVHNAQSLSEEARRRTEELEWQLRNSAGQPVTPQ